MNKLMAMLGLALLLSACSSASKNVMTVEGHFDRGRERLRAKDYHGAIAHFNRVILFQPKHSLAHFERAKAHQASKNLDGALEDLNAAIHLNPAMAEAYAARGRILLEKGDAQAAAADFSKAIELKPSLKPELTTLPIPRLNWRNKSPDPTAPNGEARCHASIISDPNESVALGEPLARQKERGHPARVEQRLLCHLFREQSIAGRMPALLWWVSLMIEDVKNTRTKFLTLRHGIITLPAWQIPS